MRPLTLNMTAFGPFPGCERIDFEKFGSSPLFLINGPTGSGKTTILDAISFALYGKTTGDEREGGQMRCDLAPAETLCEISFEFVLHDRYFQIRRIPEQQRPKARGDGLTEQKPEAQLVEFLPDGTNKLLVASKVSEATRAIEELTGLSADQFRQVMVLPQGKFRQLLLAESAQREKIFSQLFQTGIYKKLEERLKERSASIRRDREACLQQQQGILESIESASVEELSHELKALKVTHDTALKDKTACEAAYLKSHQDLTNAQRLDQDFNQQQDISEKLSLLESRQPVIDQLSAGLSAAQQASKLTPLFEQRDRSVKAVAEATQRVSDCHRSYQRAAVSLQQSENEQQRLAPLQQESDERKIQLQRLEQHRMQALQLRQVKGRCEELQQRAELHKIFSQRLTIREQLIDVKHYLTQKNSLEKLNLLLEQAELTGRKIAENVVSRRNDAKHLELAWHQGQAALLAAELKAGEACPVCGSCDHPQPADTDLDVPDVQQLEAIRDELTGLEEQLENARERYVELRTKVINQTDDVAEISSRIGDNGEQKLQELKLSLARLDAEIASFEIEDKDNLQQLDVATLNDRTVLLSEELAGVVRERELLEKELPTAYHEATSLDKDRQILHQDIAERERLIEKIRTCHREAYATLEAASVTKKESEQRLQQLRDEEKQGIAACHDALEHSSFDQENDYIQALRGDDEMIAMQQKIEHYKEERQQLVGGKLELQKKLSGHRRPDLSSIQDSFNDAVDKKNTAEQNWQLIDSRFKQVQATLQKLAANLARLDKLDGDYAVVGTLSDVAAGQTGEKVSLQRFVLSVLLDDVLLAASTRLAAMSKGRYRLLRKEDRSKGNKASGLELMVDDAYTGKVRPVATLSGGESFMAALSLALGLSEVVQAYSGGVRLDTLFIDEGFGSLDSESLDLAISTLMDLQSAGRTIGLISHVGDLKEQIPLRIDVEQSRSGSRVALVCP